MYGIAHHLEQLLDGAVLAVAAVQRDERDVRLLGAEPLDEVRADVDRDHLVPEALERILAPAPPTSATPGARASGRP